MWVNIKITRALWALWKPPETWHNSSGQYRAQLGCFPLSSQQGDNNSDHMAQSFHLKFPRGAAVVQLVSIYSYSYEIECSNFGQVEAWVAYHIRIFLLNAPGQAHDRLHGIAINSIFS